MPKHSVIITTHARPALLQRALQSVRRQNFAELAVIVVADERSRETRDAALGHLGPTDLFIARGGVPGPAASRNLGLAVASSDYVLFLDDDDELSADMIPAMDAAIGGAKDDVFYCDFWYVPDGPDRAVETGIAPTPVRIGDRDVQELYVKNFIPNSCLIYPAATVRTKRFDEALGLNEDWDFLLNVLRDSALAYVPIHGPVIHQSPSEQADRRGVQNEGLILDVMPRIYRKWPAPTDALRASRQALFATSGMMLPLDDL
jgi:glycosyltransferase involved in cell wall biosynthesis